jgi:predicted neuraminidase
MERVLFQLIGVVCLVGVLAQALTAADLGIVLAEKITVGGVKIAPASPPKGLKTYANLGIIANRCMAAQRVHARPVGEGCFIEAPRAVKTPAGDFLVMFPAGKGHYGGKLRTKKNDMVAYRSSDRGMTWTGPTIPWDVPYSMHGFIPFIPRGSKRIYAFGTEPIPDRREGAENAPIAFRTSDDDGRTWSKPTLIRPVNDPEFLGMSLMRMCETDSGTWLLGTHAARWKRTKKAPLSTRQYVLRSEDRGKAWTLLPDRRPNGWCLEAFDRMDEGRIISLGGNKALLMVRTAEGHLWQLRSEDGGKTWSGPAPTTLVHPDAPPMLFHLSDGKTLVAFHHNRYSTKRPHFNRQDRSELWCSLSTDDGKTWSEPRFVLANAAKPGPGWGNPNAKVFSVSYDDLLVDGDDLHLFVDFQTRQVLHVRFKVSDLKMLPTKEDLTRR